MRFFVATAVAIFAVRQVRTRVVGESCGAALVKTGGKLRGGSASVL